MTDNLSKEMTVNEKTLMSIGKDVPEGMERDAIHIAVLPVKIAEGESLKPGQRVGLTGEGRASATATPVVGVMDPFWPYDEMSHGRFWLFMLPGTITGLRHHWTHPALEKPTDVDLSRAWVSSFAAEMGIDFDRLMDAADMMACHDDYTYDNTERYKNVDYAKWPVFWQHYAVIKGAPEEWERGKREDCPFTCSC